MNNAVARLFVAAQAEQARIEGMKAENQRRIDCGHSIAYGEEAFSIAAGNLDRISHEMAESSNFKD